MTVPLHGFAISRVTRPFAMASNPPISGSRSVQTSVSAVEQRTCRLAAVRRLNHTVLFPAKPYDTVFTVKYLKLHGKFTRHIARFENVSGRSLKMNADFDQH